MKKFLLLLSAAAGLSFLALSNNAEADCRYRSSYRGFSNQSYRGGFNSHFHGGYSSRSYSRGGLYGGHPGYYGAYPGYSRGGYHGGYYGGPGFGIQTPGFGLFIR